MMDNCNGLEMVAETLKKEYPTGLLFQLRENGRLSLALQCYRVRGYMLIEEGTYENAKAMFRAGKILSDATWEREIIHRLGLRKI